MATLEKIRNKAGLLVIVVGLALFAFIIGDFLRSGSTFFQQSKEKVIVADGNSVGIREFQERVEYLTNMYKGSGNLTEEQQYQLREMVFQEMVNKILLDETAEKIGLAVGETEESDLILGNNPSALILQIPDFQNPQTGQFDRSAFLQFVQMAETEDISMYPAEYQQQILSMKKYWEDVKENVINYQLNTKLSSLLLSGIVYNSLDAQKEFNETSVSVDFDYVSQSFSSIPDSTVSVSNAEIAKLYEERKESFKQSEAKIIDYIAVNIVPSKKDFEEIETLLEKAKQELIQSSNAADIVNDNSDVPFKDIFMSSKDLGAEVTNFVQSNAIGSTYGPILTGDTYNLYKLLDTKQAPDSAFINILTLPTFTDQNMLKNFSDSLVNELKKGKTFSEMALEATGGQGNGEMGWQTESTLANNGVDNRIIDAVFSAKLKEPQVIKSTVGTHLIQVTERTKDITKYKVANISINVVPSMDTHNNLYNDLNQYILKNNNVTAFRDNASEAGFYVQPGVSVQVNQNSLSGIGNSRQVVRWAFENKKGSISDVFECDGYFVATTVTGATKEGYRSQDEVSDILKRELINKKKGEIIVANLKSQNLTTMDQFAEAMNSNVRKTQFVTFKTPQITGIGMDPVVNAKAVASEVGELTGPFAGKNAVYVLSLTDKTTGDKVFNEADIKNQLSMQNMYRIGQAIQSGSMLQENAKIEDNRSRFY